MNRVSLIIRAGVTVAGGVAALALAAPARADRFFNCVSICVGVCPGNPAQFCQSYDCAPNGTCQEAPCDGASFRVVCL